MTRTRIGLRALSVALCLYAWNAAASPLPATLRPAIVAPGGSIRVDAAEQGLPIALSGPASIPLEVEWSASPADGVHARCAIPAEIPPGRYDLAVGDAAPRQGAVWVVEEIPASYRIAFLAGRDADGLAKALEAAVAAEALALVFIGPGDDAAADPFLETLNAAAMPVLMTGVGRRAAAPYPFAVAVGQDTLYFHDPLVTRLGAADGALHRLRRAARASRWSIAVWPQYDPFTGRRAQLILFADDPVDLFVAPLAEIPERVEDAPFPGFWPRVRFEPLAAGAADTLLVVEVTPTVLRTQRIPLEQPGAGRTGRQRDRPTPEIDGD